MTPAEKTAFRCLPASDAAALIRNEPTAAVFDVRDMASYQRAHVDGAAHLSEDRLLAWMKRLPKETPVVIYCYHGNASKTWAGMFAILMWLLQPGMSLLNLLAMGLLGFGLVGLDALEHDFMGEHRAGAAGVDHHLLDPALAFDEGRGHRPARLSDQRAASATPRPSRHAARSLRARVKFWRKVLSFMWSRSASTSSGSAFYGNAKRDVVIGRYTG